MTYFVNFDSNNKIDGFFNDQINSLIPETAIQVSDEKWQELSANPEMYILENGQITLTTSQPQSTVIPQINWAEFNRGMQGDAAYNQFITDSSDKDAVRRLESLAISLGVANKQEVQGIETLWNAVADSLPIEKKPSSSAIQAWNEIAAQCQMPFRFGEDFKMRGNYETQS